MKRNLYFGGNKTEEIERIHGLWIKSIVAYIVGAIFMVLSQEHILAAFAAFPFFFYVWGFRAYFSKGNSLINSIIDIIPIDVVRWLIRLFFFFLFGFFAGVYFFIIGNLRLYHLKKGEGYET